MLKHDFSLEFPQYSELIHTRKMEDHHFKKIYDEYSQLDQHIGRIEHGSKIASDEYLHQLKQERVQSKDELISYLNSKQG